MRDIGAMTPHPAALSDMTIEQFVSQIVEVARDCGGSILYVGADQEIIPRALVKFRCEVQVLDLCQKEEGVCGIANASTERGPYKMIIFPASAYAAAQAYPRDPPIESYLTALLADDGVVVIDRALVENRVTGLERMLRDMGLVVVDQCKSKNPEVQSLLLSFKRKRRATLCFPFSPLTLQEKIDEILVLTEGAGCRVRDASGKEYIDACSGLWNTLIGLGNSYVISAITEQLNKIAYATLFIERANQPAIKLADELRAMAPYPLQWVCLTGSGSECTDLALRLAVLYKMLAGAKEQKKVAYLDESYHGTFGSSVSVSGLMPLKEIFQHTIMTVPLPTPNSDRCPSGLSYIEFAISCADALEQKARKGDIAALIVEPLLASAGVVVPPKEYFERITEICRKHDILLIVDEVATGFGRTGRWFACEHYGIEPDIMLLAKGINSGYLPLGAVLFSARIGEQFIKSNMPLPHGSTYNGHPVCCASAIANIRIMKEQQLVDRGAALGEYLLGALQPLNALECVREVRGMGLMRAVALIQEDGSNATGDQTFELSKKLERAGVLIFPTASTLTVVPPLTISAEEIDIVAATLRDIIASVRLSDGEVHLTGACNASVPI